MPWVKRRVAPVESFPYKPPTIVSFWLREHLVLGIFFPRKLYPNLPRTLSRGPRVFMLIFVFLLAFVGALVAQAFIMPIPRCSGAAYCYAACQRENPSVDGCRDLGGKTSFSYRSALGLSFFSYPASTHPRFRWCQSSGLNPPLCIAACVNGTGGSNEQRPFCGALPAERRHDLICVKPSSVYACRKTGTARDLLCNTAIGDPVPCSWSSSALWRAMRSDARASESRTTELLLLLLIAGLVFVFSTIIRQLLLFITKKGRCCCSALVIRSCGCIIVLVLLLALILLSVGLNSALSGSGWWAAIRRFLISFGISLAVDFLKLVLFFYVFPNFRKKWTAAYNVLRCEFEGAYEPTDSWGGTAASADDAAAASAAAYAAQLVAQQQAQQAQQAAASSTGFVGYGPPYGPATQGYAAPSQPYGLQPGHSSSLRGARSGADASVVAAVRADLHRDLQADNRASSTTW